MSVETFEAFKAELLTLRDILLSTNKKTVREEFLLDRFRTLFRTWASIVHPAIEPFLPSKRDFLKLGTELEALARLTAKYKPVALYRKRLNTAIKLANDLVLFLPPTAVERTTTHPIFSFLFEPTAIEKTTTRPYRDDLFLPAIPDLTVNLVPNPLIGWKSKIETFLDKFPFDKSVFIMIRYRERNKGLLKIIKAVLEEHGLNGILASEHNLTDDLYNPTACLLSCSKGIAIFDKAEAGQKFNPNVAYELGMLHLLGRSCLILKHQSLKTLHTDILMRLYCEYKTSEDARKQAHHWVKSL